MDKFLVVLNLNNNYVFNIADSPLPPENILAQEGTYFILDPVNRRHW